jgi:hypothetical protein
MAFHDLIVKEQKSPTDNVQIMNSLRGLAGRIDSGTHYETTVNRQNNIALTKGLIQQYFASPVPPVFGHGASLLLDFENAMRRSKIESSRYEFKQGILRLDTKRDIDKDLISRLVETACGIANLGPDADGQIFIGIADKDADVIRIKAIDQIEPYKISDHFVVGIDREATILRKSLEDYVRLFVSAFESSDLSDPLKTHILGSFDTFHVHGLSVIRILIPKQKSLSFVGNKAYIRRMSSTVELQGQEIIAASQLFQRVI